MDAFRVPAVQVPYRQEMPISRRQEAVFLFLGDLFFLACSLLLTVFIRYPESLSVNVLTIHFVPFSFLFLVSTLVFFIAGLYDKHTLEVKASLPATVLYAQIANMVIAAAFFFLVPVFSIQPKVFLFVYLLISTTVLSFWRMYVFPVVSMRRSAPALLVGSGAEAREVLEEVNGNTRYAIRFEGFYDTEGNAPDAAVVEEKIRTLSPAVVVMPSSYLRNTAFASRWAAVSDALEYADLADVYEELFDRTALPLLDERILVYAPARETLLYTALKRAMDVLISGVALIVLSPLLLIVFVALKAKGGNALIFQERIGLGNLPIRIIKFRTMLFDDAEDPEKKKANRITKFGAFLRKWQIDEVPQFWNVLMGDLSLIGPRPEVPLLVAEYEKHIPFYAARHLIQPGISGWAQVRHASPPKWKLDVAATQNKLSYDLYYMKRRSVVLDALIALRTVQILLKRASK